MRPGKTTKRRCAMRFVAAWCMAALWVSCLVAGAQTGGLPEDDDIIVNIEPRYITAYRDGSWVPVDVVIRNDKHDVNGWVELRCKVGDDVQSPIYRVPADLPKGSTKRFRLYCRFSGTTRIEVMLYGARRAELSLPMRVDLRPISQRDALCLILNDEPGAFGFLVRVAQEATGGGFYHDTLDSSMLPLMPDRVECYDGYNAVIMGEIDPGRISPQAREALTSYVMRGGALIIATGANAPRYRGSWVEDLADVRMGEPRAWNEQELAAAVFPPDLQAGASPVRQCLAASLAPGDACTQVVGRDPLLATHRPLGAGGVTTIAVGPKDEALQQCAGLRELWRDLLTLHQPGSDLQIAEAARIVANDLPSVAGVRIVPRSIVVAYLALYLLVGVALNWTVWTVLRRREMAWVTLVVLSLGFTAFAVLYGSAGRLSAAELYEYRVIEAPAHEAPARLHAVTGILAGRSASYDLDVALDRALVQEASGASGGMMVVSPRGLFSTARSRPFQWIQSDPQVLRGVGLGASEARVIVVQGQAESLGRASADLGLSSEGKPPERFVVNWTGPPLEQPMLSVAGIGYQLKREDDVYVVAMGDQFAAPLYGYGSWGVAGDSYLLRNIQRAVTGSPSYGYGFGFSSIPDSLDTSRKAYLTGWISSDEAPSALIASSIENRTRRSLVVAEVEDATPSDRALVWLDVRTMNANMGMFPFPPDQLYPLPVLPGEQGMAGLPGLPPMPVPMAENQARSLAAMGYGGRAFLCHLEVAPLQDTQARIIVPGEFFLDPSAELSLWLEPLAAEDVEVDVALVKEGLPDFPLVGARDVDSPESPFRWGDLDERLYRPTQWRDYYDPTTGEILVRVKRPPDAALDAQTATVRLAASVSRATAKLRSAAWRDPSVEASATAEEEMSRDRSDE